MQRMYVSLSLVLWLVSFQANSADSKGEDLGQSSCNSGSDYNASEEDLAMLGMTKHPYNRVVGGRTILEHLKAIAKNNHDNCSFSDPTPSPEESYTCAAFLGLRKKLISIQFWEIKRALKDPQQDVAETTYRAYRLLEFNRPIMQPAMIKALEEILLSCKGAEREKLTILLTHYAVNNSVELMTLYGYFLPPNSEKQVQQPNEDFEKSKEFLIPYTKSFLNDPWIKPVLSATYQDTLSKLSK